MKKHLFLKSLLIAIGLLVTSLTTQAWAAKIDNTNWANFYNTCTNSSISLSNSNNNKYTGVVYMPASSTYEVKIQTGKNSEWSGWYRTDGSSAYTFTSVNTTYDGLAQKDGNDKITTKSSTSGFVKVNVEFWGEYSGNSSLRLYQSDVDALSLASLGRSSSTVASNGTITVTPNTPAGGSGSYHYEYSCSPIGYMDGSTFHAPYVFTPTEVTITVTMTDNNSQLSGLASVQKTTTVTVNRPDNMYIKTQFNDFDTWGWVTLPSNGDGTYSVTAKYKGNTGCNWSVTSGDESQYIEHTSYTKVHDAVNDPLSNGDDCTFKLTPTSWTDASKVASVTITKRVAVTATKVSLGNGAGSEGTPSISGTSYADGKVDYNTSVTFTAPDEATGYRWKGWYTNNTGTGAAYNSNKSFTETVTCAKTYYAIYEPIGYKITFDATTNGGTITANGSTYEEGGKRKLTETYDAAVTGTAPTAVKNGWHFLGWYTTASVGGYKLIGADGTWSTNVATYISSGAWVKADNITLYARYNHGINFISFTDYYNVMPGADVVGAVHFNTDAEPEGNFTLCYVLTTDGGERMFDQPDFERSYSDGYHKVTFAAPVTPGDYTLQVRLYAEANHDCATEAGYLDKYDGLEFTFTVEHTNTVTVQYQCGSVDVRPSTTVQATAYSTAVSVTAPTIKGLTFTGWTLGANVTSSDALTSNPISIHASAAGTLTANYSQSGYVYFKNTYGWDNVYFYRYNNQSYWGSSNTGDYGIGAHGDSDKWTSYCEEGPIEMEKVDGTDDLYYCKPSSTPGSTQSYVFTDKPSTEYFFGRTDDFYPINVLVLNNTAFSQSSSSAFSTTNHMIVPNKDQTPINPGGNYNGKVSYYTEYFVIPSLADWEWTLRGNWGWSTPSAYCHFKAPTMGSTTFQTHRYFDNETGWDHYIQVYDNSGADKGHYGVVSGAIEATTSSPTELGKQTGSEDRNIRFRTNNQGDYTFNLSFEPSANQKGGFAGKIKLSVTYPIETGDFRLVYTGGTKNHPGNVIKKRANGEDIVSMYVAAGNYDELVLQPCSTVTADAVVWTAMASCSAPTYADGVDFEDILNKSGAGVYNFTFTQDENKVAKITKVEKYVGPFYIRTDCVNSDQWNYWDSKDDHTMTYSDYSTTLTADPYSHYYVKWISESNVIVKFCVANDYSVAISDTLDADDVLTGTNVKVSATNVRFMYNQATNTLKRAYTYGPIDENYMLLRTKSIADGTKAWLYKSWTNSSTYTRLGTNTLDEVLCDTLKFTDNGNWVYQADVYTRPGAPVKLTGSFGGNTQYFKGSEGTTYTTDAVQLIGGTTGDPQRVRITYDFKTNRMVTAWMPSGSALADDLDLKADVMIIRRHQEPGASITFSGDHKISNVKTVYGVIQLDSATLNNVTLSKYERDLFWISFPFDVKLSDVFGFGNYYEHWGIQYYDGKNRAKNGYWIDSQANWKFFTPGMRDTTILKANEGYVLAVDLDLLGPGASVWDNNVNKIYLYFPSTAELGTIQNATSKTVDIDTVGYTCTIDRRINKEVANSNLDRRVVDSHWHCIGAPSFAGAEHSAGTSFDSNDVPNINPTNWATTMVPFVYDWDATTNTLSPIKTGTVTFKAMHSYLVQYSQPTITWEDVVVAVPASIIARQRKQQADFDLTLHILRGANSTDQTFIRLTDNEEVTDDFEFNHDLSKETNKSIANVWTMTVDGTPAAGNSMPFSSETKVVPVGVKTPAADNYTFSMPEGTNGVSVVFVDKETGERTNLSLTDYTVNLEAGQYDGRFSLEIAPIQYVPTDIELLNGENGENGVRKVMVDGILYIVKDGKVFDARGNRVK